MSPPVERAGPPETRRDVVTETLHDTDVPDPYRWLEADDEAVAEWTDAQNAYAEAVLDTHNYPATGEELIDEYGDAELDLPNGDETLGEAMGRLGDTTYQNSEDAKLAAMSAVSEDAIGPSSPSDR